ncbi:MAG: hypothetical protein KF812_08595 [Fimbriimonadaceae bacterium]|nr:hypothetical protein [Fimbriimonadaceae bacterium]
MASVEEVCNILSIERGALPDVRLAKTEGQISITDLEWILSCELINRDAKVVLERGELQRQALDVTERDRGSILLEQWRDRFKPLRFFPSVSSYIQIECELEARKTDLFDGAITRFRRLLASSMVSQFPAHDHTSAGTYRILRVQPSQETLRFIRDVGAAEEDWVVHGRNAGLTESQALHLQSFYKSVRGDSSVILLANTPQGQQVLIEFQDSSRSVSSEIALIKFEAPPAGATFHFNSRSGTVNVRWPLGQYLSEPFDRRDKSLARQVLNWPLWLSELIESETGKSVIAWYPDRIASELVITAGRFSQAKEIKLNDALDLVNRWCSIVDLGDRILIRPRWIRWEEEMMLSDETWRRTEASLTDKGTILPSELGRIALENEKIGFAHPAEAILGMLGDVPIAPFEVGTWLALAAAADNMSPEPTAFSRLSLNMRNKLQYELIATRFRVLKDKTLTNSDAQIDATLKNALFWLERNMNQTYMIQEPFVWNYDLPRPYSRFLSIGYVDSIRTRYQGQRNSPMIQPLTEYRANLKSTVNEVEVHHGSATTGTKPNGRLEPLVPRP